MTFETTIYRDTDDGEIEFGVIVSFIPYRGCRGHRDKYGVPEEPDEDPSIEIVSVKDKDTQQEVECSQSELDKLEEEAWKELEE